MARHCVGLFCFLVAIHGPVQAAEKVEAASLVETSDLRSLLMTKPVGTRPVAKKEQTDSARPARLFVLAVGINAYPAKDRLSFAVKDARDVTRTLRTKGRKAFRQVEVKLLTDHQADRQGILDGISWLQREVTAADTAVIYYSGHGAEHPNVGFFLVPARFKDAQPLKTMVSGTELKRAVKQVRGPVVVVLDCCYSGSILNRRPGTPASQSILAARADTEEPTPGLAFLCASRRGEESEEKRAIRNGTFTKALVQALSGKADLNQDGVVTLGEVERFVKQRVPKASKGQQHAVSFRSALPPTTPLARP